MRHCARSAAPSCGSLSVDVTLLQIACCELLDRGRKGRKPASSWANGSNTGVCTRPCSVDSPASRPLKEAALQGSSVELSPAQPPQTRLAATPACAVAPPLHLCTLSDCHSAACGLAMSEPASEPCAFGGFAHAAQPACHVPFDGASAPDRACSLRPWLRHSGVC